MQKTQSSPSTTAAGQADSTRIAEILISLRRILDLTSASTTDQDRVLCLARYEAENALRAAQSLSEPALA